MTLHLLQFVSDEGYRRLIGAQLNVTEARHRVARKIFFGQRGELRQHYREGMEEIGSARSASRSTPWRCSTPCTSTRPPGSSPPTASRSPTTCRRAVTLQYDHINFLGEVRLDMTSRLSLSPGHAPVGQRP